jgi:Inner membrane protein YgaP-like, transmembrane domain
MCNEMVIRRIAGIFILLSLGLGWWVSPYWLLFTAFVGFNLLQSSLTGFCPLERMLGRFHLFGCTPKTAPS